MLRDLLAAPRFPDPALTTRARTLHTVVVALIVIVFPVYLGIYAFSGPDVRVLALQNLVSNGLLCVLLLALNRHGWTRTAGALLIGGLLARIGVNAFYAGGLHSPGIGFQLVLVLLAGVLLGEGAGLITAAVCALTSLGFAVAEMTQALPPASIVYSPLTRWLLFTQFLILAILAARLAARTIAETNERNRRLARDLGERLKEMSCLRAVSDMLHDKTLDKNSWLRETVKLLPPAYQFPAVTAASIRLGDEHFESDGFRQTRWLQSSSFAGGTEGSGTIEVAYLGECPPGAESPFLPEEQVLLNSVAGMLSSAFERRLLEEQFRQAQRMDALGSLAAGVAHDFNNLSTVILGGCDLLLEGLPIGDKRREELHLIQDAGKRAENLTRQLLAFSRGSAQAAEVLDINSIVQDNEELLRRLIGDKVVLETVLEPAIAAVRMDPGLLSQVLLNLSVNARDAMPKGGRLRIQTQNVRLDKAHCLRHPGSRLGDHVLLEVQDTGLGIPAEILDRIFEPFFTTKEIGRGTGLGLSIVHGLAGQVGGHLAVESVEGAGTTFKLYFPALPSLTPAGWKRPDASLNGSEQVLVVDDDEAVLNVIENVLSRHGYRVLRATDGVKALRMILDHAGKIDLLITDLALPGLNGRELANAARDRFPGTKVLVVSGRSKDQYGRTSTGRPPFLRKPFTPHEIAQKVREVLDA